MPQAYTNNPTKSQVKEHKHITVGDVLDGPDPFQQKPKGVSDDFNQ